MNVQVYYFTFQIQFEPNNQTFSAMELLETENHVTGFYI